MIGVFDSGVGGLSVLLEIRALEPRADLLYVADRARAPYGTHSLSEVETMTYEVADWLIARGASTLVVACNTASAAALHSLRSRHSQVPIVGMEPAVKPGTEATSSGAIAVFATAATFQGELFESVMSRYAGHAEVDTRVCPDWLDLVEAGQISGAQVEEAVAAEVTPAVAAGADVLVIGCTHFSFLRPVIESLAGPEVTVYDPAGAVAAQTIRVAGQPGSNGSLRLAGSGDLDELGDLAARLAGITAEGALLPFP